MQRRSYLTALGGVLAVATAGCMSVADDTGGPKDDTGDPKDDDTGDSTPVDGSTTTTDSPAGSTATDEAVAFADVACPPFADTADRTICSTTAGSDAPVRLDPPRPAVFEPTTGDDTVETFPITLHNDSGTTFGFNPYAWALKRHTDEGWVHVAPDAVIQPWMELSPGETYTYVLSVESHPSPHADTRKAIVQNLDSGTYALVVDGLLGEGDSRERIECVALFSVHRTER